jgi:hypothetical protein
MSFFEKLGQGMLNAPSGFAKGFKHYSDNWQKQYQASQDSFNNVSKTNPSLSEQLGDKDWSKANPEEIWDLQTSLVGQYGEGILPKHGIDGVWGSETQAALDVANTSTAKNKLLTEDKTGVVATQSYDTPVYSAPSWSGMKKF